MKIHSEYVDEPLLKYGLALVLAFIGAKMLIAPWYHIPTLASLIVVIILIAASVVASLLATRNGKRVGNATDFSKLPHE
jgi:predicted tellurium resistance membrane protein TerC